MITKARKSLKDIYYQIPSLTESSRTIEEDPCISEKNKRNSYIPSKNLAFANVMRNKKSLISTLSTEENTRRLSLSVNSRKKSRKKIMFLEKDPKLKYLQNSDFDLIFDNSLDKQNKKEKNFEIKKDIKRAKTSVDLKKFSKTLPLLYNESHHISHNTEYNNGIKLLSINLLRRLIKRNSKIDLDEHKKSLLGEKLFFQVAAPLDCVEEHIITNIKPGDKYARFKKLLKIQERKNIKLLNDAKQAVTLNEKMLKVDITKMVTTEYKRTHLKNFVNKK